MSWLYIAGMPILAGLSAATTGGAVAVAQTEVPAAPVTATAAEDAVQTLALRADAYRRMTVPVTVNGQGPYHFMVDTGAQATVLSHTLADQLQLTERMTATLVGMASTREVQTTMIDEISFGSHTAFGARATVRLSLILWGASGLLMLAVPWPGPLAALLAVPYLVNAAPWWSVTDAAAGETNVAWRRFIGLNYGCGFAVTLLLIAAWNGV